MKAVFLTPSLSRNLGGIFEIERSLAHGLDRLGVEIEVVGLEDDQREADAASWSPLRTTAFDVRGPGSFGYSSGLARHVLHSEADLLHLHALWMFPSVIAGQWGRRSKRPYLVTPNGMLEPWALANSRWKKKVASALYEKRMLRGATCLQANTEKELQDFRAFGLANPVAVIPNGVSLPEEDGRPDAPKPQRKILLFLGRLHPKKGLVNALKAWKLQGADDWQLVIAGWDQGGHDAELVQLCGDLGLRHARISAAEFLEESKPNPATVIFTGPAFGPDKDALLQAASAFILPSFSEGLPMSVLEAWAHRLPVLMTDACNLPAGFEENAAIRIGTDVPSISEGLLRLAGAGVPELESMGRRGRLLVERQFTWERIAEEMKAVYSWMLGSGDRPASIR